MYYVHGILILYESVVFIISMLEKYEDEMCIVFFCLKNYRLFALLSDKFVNFILRHCTNKITLDFLR